MSARMHLRNLAVPAMVMLAAATWVAAAGGASAAGAGNMAKDSMRSDPAKVTIKSSTVSGLGPVLVNGNGRVLYIFEPDKRDKVTCTATCTAVWPPVVAKAGRKPAAAGAVKQSMLGTVANPDGSGRVVTYHGWPLYTYVADTGAGQANGQALKLNGGLWYVISPAGQVIKKKP